jgi:hypothetical protein
MAEDISSSSDDDNHMSDDSQQAIFAKFLTSIFGTLYGLVRTFVYNFLVVSFGSGLLLIGWSKLLKNWEILTSAPEEPCWGLAAMKLA